MNDAPETMWMRRYNSGDYFMSREKKPYWPSELGYEDFGYRRADLPATRAQIMASPEVQGLAMLIRKCRPAVANMAYGWPEAAALVQEIDAALAAFKAMEAGE